jgi:hypothetical protein
VIVAVIAVRMMQTAVHQIIDMVAMRDRLVPAVRAMLVLAVGFGRAAHGICRIDRDGMLVDVILVHVMKMTIVKIVHVVSMPDRGVTAIRAMFVSVVQMVLLVADHEISFPSPGNPTR